MNKNSSFLNRIFSFLNEVKAELAKVVWPRRDDLVGSSIIVCLLAVVAAGILGLMDFGFSQFIRGLIG